MKRVIVAITLVLAVLVLFSGCDPILEALFPELVDGGFGKKIVVYVDIDSEILTGIVYQEGAILVGVVPFYEKEFGLEMAPEEMWVQEWGLTEYIETGFEPLQNTVYRVIIWWDGPDDNGDRNWLPDFDEPSVLASYEEIDEMGRTWWNDQVDFRWMDENSVDVFAYLWSGDQIPSEMIDKLHQGGEGREFDPSIRFDGPGVVDAYNLMSFEYVVKPRDPNAPPIEKIVWRLLHHVDPWDPMTWVYRSVGGMTEHEVNWNNRFWVDFWDVSPSPDPTLWSDYTLEVDVMYEGGVWWGAGKQIVALDEGPGGWTYTLKVDLFDLASDPVWLDWSANYDFMVRVFRSNNSRFSDPGDVWDKLEYFPSTQILGGEVWDVTVTQLQYQTSPGSDGAQIVIDANRNGQFGDPGDWRSLVKAIPLEQDTSETWVSFGGWDFFPIN
jgi:hypothetical protein